MARSFQFAAREMAMPGHSNMVRKRNKAAGDSWMLMLSGWTLVAPGVISVSEGEGSAGGVMIAAGAAIVAWAVATLKPARAQA
jgi:hypothetical protein